MLASEWEADVITPSKLPDLATIFDVIFSTPTAREHFRDELKVRYLQMHEFEGQPETEITDENIDSVIDAVHHQINEIKTEPNIDDVLIPQVCIQDTYEDDNTFKIVTQSALFKFDELKYHKRYANEKPIVSRTDTSYSDDDYDYMMEHSINGYAYEFSPWNEILSYKVYVPSHLTEKQCYEFYVDIFWEMTFFGIDRGEAEQRQQELEEELQESMEEYETWKEEGTLDEHLIKPDLDKHLTELYGTYRREYMKRMTDYTMIMSHNLGILNARDVYGLYKKIQNI